MPTTTTTTTTTTTETIAFNCKLKEAEQREKASEKKNVTLLQ